MKIKQQVVIREPNRFLRGDYVATFTLYGIDCEFIPDEWIKCGTVEFDIEVNSDDVIKIVSETIEEEIEKEKGDHYARMTALQSRLSELLALEPPK